MNTCTRCGAPLPQENNYCDRCGAWSCRKLNSYRSLLRAEQIAWIVGAAVQLLLLMWGILIVPYMYQNQYPSPEMWANDFLRNYMYFVMLPMYIMYGIAILAQAVFGILSAVRLRRLIRGNDGEAVVRRGGRVFRLVLSFLCNPVAAIFFLVNFVRIRTER